MTCNSPLDSDTLDWTHDSFLFLGLFQNQMYQQFADRCLGLCPCKRFQHSFSGGNGDSGQCYLKKQLLNEHRSPGFLGAFMLRVRLFQDYDESERAIGLVSGGSSSGEENVLERPYVEKKRKWIFEVLDVIFFLFPLLIALSVYVMQLSSDTDAASFVHLYKAETYRLVTEYWILPTPLSETYGYCCWTIHQLPKVSAINRRLIRCNRSYYICELLGQKEPARILYSSDHHLCEINAIYLL
ncbi:hypothetical protein VNO78_12302 [Psophocarpus tetragonolobus]|uniref:Uncharacterized protein n=1 Tax=Psophocarpus tetragonolobus TaxID=3891 RepID=A0AAN9SVL7_PSOTE